MIEIYNNVKVENKIGQEDNKCNDKVFIIYQDNGIKRTEELTKIYRLE